VEITQGVFTQAVNHFKLDVCLVSSSLLIEGSVEHNVFIIRQLVTRTSLDLTRVRTSDVGSILPVWDGWMSLCQEKIQRSIGKVTVEYILDNEYFHYITLRGRVTTMEADVHLPCSVVCLLPQARLMRPAGSKLVSGVINN
jgi:hypothetical protein